MSIMRSSADSSYALAEPASSSTKQQLSAAAVVVTHPPETCAAGADNLAQKNTAAENLVARPADSGEF
jgi:hypothetical protein